MITVTISGHPGVGKTTLAMALEEWLRACGITEINISDADGESKEDKSRHQDRRWKELRNKAQFKIVTIHTLHE